jgi:hypothetical protein
MGSKSIIKSQFKKSLRSRVSNASSSCSFGTDEESKSGAGSNKSKEDFEAQEIRAKAVKNRRNPKGTVQLPVDLRDDSAHQ